MREPTETDIRKAFREPAAGCQHETVTRIFLDGSPVEFPGGVCAVMCDRCGTVLVRHEEDVKE